MMNERTLEFLRWLLESGRLTGDGTVRGPSSQPITPTNGYPRWPGHQAPAYTSEAS